MADHFDLLAPLYDRVISSPDPERLKHLLRLPTSGRLLDAGGGTGRASCALRPLVGKLVISDPSGPMLQQAAARGALEAIQGSSERLPFEDESFDRIMVVDALHHFHNQQTAINELLRVLKPGGRLLIEEPDIHRWQVKLVALAEKILLMRSHFLSPQEIQTLLAAHGQEATIQSDGEFAAWIYIDKKGSHD
jgi:demethylmenaquinone methyltransferase/2-methoxy-6-polyprenyl-1,4-benzoquinol methylase